MKLYDDPEWPPIGVAVRALPPLLVAEHEGARRVGPFHWEFKGKIVTEQFLIDYVQSGWKLF